MVDYIDNGLRAMEKSLAEIVLPAVDASDPLAREQLMLAVDYLRFVRARLDVLGARARFDLAHYQSLAEQIVAAAPSTITGELPAILAATAEARASVDETPVFLRDAGERLANAIDRAVQASAHADPAVRQAVERIVLDASGRWINLEMSWYAPIAVDEDGRGLLPVASFFPFREAGSPPA